MAGIKHRWQSANNSFLSYRSILFVCHLCPCRFLSHSDIQLSSAFPKNRISCANIPLNVAHAKAHRRSIAFTSVRRTPMSGAVSSGLNKMNEIRTFFCSITNTSLLPFSTRSKSREIEGFKRTNNCLRCFFSALHRIRFICDRNHCHSRLINGAPTKVKRSERAKWNGRRTSTPSIRSAKRDENV